MKDIIKNKTIVIIAAALLFSFVSIAQASEVVDRTLSQCSSSAISSSAVLGQIFTPTASNFSSIYVSAIDTHGATSTIDFYLCEGTPNAATFTSSYNCGASGNHFVASSSISINKNGSQKFSFSNPVAISSGVQHYTSFKITNGNNTTIYTCASYQGQGVISGTTLSDWSSFSNYSATNYNNEYIAFEEPANGARFSTGSTVGLIISYFNFNDDYNAAELDLLNKEKGTLTKFNYGLIQSTSTEYLVPSLSGLSDANYRATVFMYNTYDGSTSTAATLNFVMGDYTIYDAAIPPDKCQEQILCEGVATSTFYGGVECGTKKVVCWAFTPDKEIIDELSLSFDELKKSFPFSLFFGVTDAITSASNATTTTSGYIEVPMIRKTATSSELYTIHAVTSSTMPTLIGGDNYNLFRNTISYIIWIVVAIGILMQLKPKKQE